MRTFIICWIMLLKVRSAAGPIPPTVEWVHHYTGLIILPYPKLPKVNIKMQTLKIYIQTDYLMLT